MFDVIGPGSPNDIAGRSAAEVADSIRAASGGQGIRLLSCLMGVVYSGLGQQPRCSGEGADDGYRREQSWKHADGL